MADKTAIFDSPIAHFRLIETGKPDPSGLAIDVHIISTGWGASGYYSESTLQAACQKGVYPAGMHMHWDHPTVKEEQDQPARTLSTLVGALTEAGRYERNSWDGPGVYAKAKIFPQYQEQIKAMDGHIGISHYVSGIGEDGKAPDGKKGRIIKELIPDALNTVDFVTVPGAGGHYRTLVSEAKMRLSEISAVPDNPPDSKIGKDSPNCKLSLKDFGTMPFSEIRERFAYDGNIAAGSTGKDENFSLLKLPHHDPVSGDVRPNCVRAALEAIGGSRTGTPMNLGSKTDEVKAHLQAHLDEINKSKGESKKMDSQVSIRLSEIMTSDPEVIAEIRKQEREALKIDALNAEQKNKLAEATNRIKTLEAEVGTLKTKVAEGKAREFVAAQVKEAKIPEASGRILAEVLVRQIPLAEDGSIDTVKFGEIVTGAIKAKTEEIAAILKETGRSGIHDNGFPAAGTSADAIKAQEEYRDTLIESGVSPEQANRLAGIEVKA
jgi:hypothetical protein